MSFQVYSYQHPEFGPIMLLVDDQPEEEIQIKESLDGNRRPRRPSYLKHYSNEKTHRSLERNKSIENGVKINLPAISDKKPGRYKR